MVFRRWPPDEAPPLCDACAGTWDGGAEQLVLDLMCRQSTEARRTNSGGAFSGNQAQ